MTTGTIDGALTTSRPIQAEEAEVRVAPRPNLNRDFAALIGGLMVIITYHIQHPTLLFRAQFGRSFRGDSLQEAVTLALPLSLFLLIESWPGLWASRRTAFGQIRLALVAVIALYALFNWYAIYRDTNLFLSYHSLDAETLVRQFREESFVNPVKAMNSMAVFTGLTFAALLVMGWPSRRTPPALLRTGVTLAAFPLVYLAYLNQHPVLTPDGDTRPLSVLLLGVVAILAGLWAAEIRQHSAVARPSNREAALLRVAALILLGAFALHIAAWGWFDYDAFADYYNVDRATYSELFSDTAFHDPLQAFDWTSLFAGAALGGILFLMSPWGRLGLYRDVIRANLAPLAVALLTVWAWERAIDLFEIEQFLLPSPSVIYEELNTNYPGLVAAGWLTFQNALLGFAYGCSAGILTGVVSARFTRFSRAVLPIAIAANSVPIIAFAPIANFWFGVTSIYSKVAIVAVLCYFPTMISTVRGLTSVQPLQLELMRAYAASEWAIFRHLRVPTALPLIFSALKLCTTTAMIGAIVSEFFGGSLSGLGYRIREDAALFRFPASWAAIVVASLFGISFYLLISALERVVMPWYLAYRGDSR